MRRVIKIARPCILTGIYPVCLHRTSWLPEPGPDVGERVPALPGERGRETVPESDGNLPSVYCWKRGWGLVQLSGKWATACLKKVSETIPHTNALCKKSRKVIVDDAVKVRPVYTKHQWLIWSVKVNVSVISDQFGLQTILEQLA